MYGRKQNRAGRLLVQSAIFILALSIIVLYILCLTGSTYTNLHIPQIFLAQIQKSSISIVIGLYGICTDPTASAQTCTITISRTTDSIATALFPNLDQTNAANSKSLINFALDLQQKILLSPLPIAAGLYLISLPLTLLTRMIAKRQRHLSPGRRLRYLRTFTLSVLWLSTSLTLTTAALATEMVNCVSYVVSMAGDGNMNVTAGGLLQVLLWVTAGASVGFSVVVMGILRNVRGGRDNGRCKKVDFERDWKEFEDERIFIF